MNYGYSKKVDLTYEDTLAKIKETLAEEGFGVLTEIDVKATMKNKLGVEYENYMILGACNPSFADKALTMEKEIGLLLPCNVIIYEDDGIHISAILPSVGMSMVENEELKALAGQVEESLKKAIDAV